MMNYILEFGLNNALAATVLAAIVFIITRLWRNEQGNLRGTWGQSLNSD